MSEAGNDGLNRRENCHHFIAAGVKLHHMLVDHFKLFDEDSDVLQILLQLLHPFVAGSLLTGY